MSSNRRVRGKKRVKNQYMVPPDEGSYGDLIRQLRLERGWTQIELAEKVSSPDWEIGQNHISAYERGVTKNPNIDLMNRFDAAFGLEPGTILERAGWRQAGQVQKRAAPPPGAIVTIDPDPTVRIMLQFAERGGFEGPLDETAKRQLREFLGEMATALDDAGVQVADLPDDEERDEGILRVVAKLQELQRKANAGRFTVILDMINYQLDGELGSDS